MMTSPWPASAQNQEHHSIFVIVPRPKTLPQHPSITSMCPCDLTHHSPSPWPSSGYKNPRAGALAFPIHSATAWWPHQLASTWRRGEGKEKRGGEEKPRSRSRHRRSGRRRRRRCCRLLLRVDRHSTAPLLHGRTSPCIASLLYCHHGELTTSPCSSLFVLGMVLPHRSRTGE
jgi:hypothetical protein